MAGRIKEWTGKIVAAGLVGAAILSSVLHRREECAKRRRTHIAEVRKRASEADAKLKRLYDAIQNGMTDLSEPMLKECIAVFQRQPRPGPH